MTNELKDHLMRCMEAIQSVQPILDKHSFPTEPRTLTGIGFIEVLLEHQHSILLLLMHGYAGSASALVRPVVEGAFRALWIYRPATDEQVRKFNENDKIAPDFGKIAEALDNAYDGGGLFQSFKTRTWNALNSFTHGGMLQVGRCFVQHELVNYSENAIREISTMVTTIVLFTISLFIEGHGHVDSAAQIHALLETSGLTPDGKKSVQENVS